MTIALGGSFAHMSCAKVGLGIGQENVWNVLFSKMYSYESVNVISPLQLDDSTGDFVVRKFL